MKINIRNAKLPAANLPHGIPITYNGKVVGRTMGQAVDGDIMAVVESDEIKRLLSRNNSFSIEVRSADEEIL